jgi:hypothetical protein
LKVSNTEVGRIFDLFLGKEEWRLLRVEMGLAARVLTKGENPD